MGKKVGGDSNVIFGRFSSVPLRLKEVRDIKIQADPPNLNTSAFSFKNRCNSTNISTNPSSISATSVGSLTDHSEEVDKIQRRLQSTKLSSKACVRSGLSEECKNTNEDLVSADISRITEFVARPKRNSSPTSESNNCTVKQSSPSSRATRRKSSRLSMLEETSVDTPTKKTNPPKRAKKSISPVDEPFQHISDENISSIANKPASIQVPILEPSRMIPKKTSTKQTNRRGRGTKSKREGLEVKATVESPKQINVTSVITSNKSNQDKEIVEINVKQSQRNDAPKKRIRKSSKKKSDITLRDRSVMMTQWLSDLIGLNGVSVKTFAILLEELCTQGYTLENVEINSLKDVCFYIAQCEHIAITEDHQRHELPHDYKNGRKRILSKKKQFRFRSFDLSCLSLHYIECEEVLEMVENILKMYSKANDSIQKLVSSESGRSLLYKAIDILSIIQKFTDQDASLSREVCLASDFFKEHFGIFLSSKNSPLLENIFSPLVSSYCRYLLRIVFLPFEQEGKEINEQDHLHKKIKPIEKDASYLNPPYAHQDLGAAIHFALRIYANEKHHLETRQSSETEEEEIEEVLRHLVNAHAFLLFHFRQAFDSSIQEEEEEVIFAWGALKRVCEMARRLNFQDEVYLFPLADLSSFLQDLEQHSEAVKKLQDQILEQEKEIQKKVYENLKCGDCHEQISPSEKASSISCNKCSGMYHLR
jgi:ribosomal protein S27E